MPQAVLLPIAGVLFNIGAPLAVVNAVAGVGLAGTIFTGAVGFGLAVGANYLTSALLGPSRRSPAMPTPEDGKYNLKQNVPSLSVVYGRRKKGGDYVFLEERGGVAYHLLVHAAHEVEGYVSHYLNDSVATLDGSGYVTSVNSQDEDADKYYVLNGSSKVRIQTKTGQAAEAAYSTLTSVFSDIWTSAHRGDGLASTLMAVESVGANDYTTVFPGGMPQHNAVLDGKKLYDPRTGTTAFSKNLALIRLDHLLAPFGGKQKLEDIDLDSWSNFANVCDENVTNRDGGTEKRYHGGVWFRYENDPVEVGRAIDEAADCVLYETAEGKIAVHAGEWVEPDIHLTDDDISSFSYLANRDPSRAVIAVRGRWIDPSQDYNKVDSAIYGDPYVSDDDERAGTLDTEVVDSHNHIQRLQKIRYTRARGARVQISCDYWAAINLPFRRFVKITKLPQLNGAYIEIIGRPKLILFPELKFEFEGIVVPSSLYSFDAATEEGEPGGVPVKIGSSGIPDVADFAVTIKTADVGGGTVAPYAEATFTSASDALIYELEYEQTSGGAASSLTASNGDETIDTGYLIDNVEYKFRMRARSAVGSYGDWTSYITLTAVADSTPPAEPTGFDATDGVGQADLVWVNPNSANFVSIRVYRGATATFGSASLVATIYNGAQSYSDTGLAADDYYYWITSANGSGVESSEVSAASNPVAVT